MIVSNAFTEIYSISIPSKRGCCNISLQKSLFSVDRAFFIFAFFPNGIVKLGGDLFVEQNRWRLALDLSLTY